MSERGSAEHELAEIMRDDRAMMLNPKWWPIQFPQAQLAIKHTRITATFSGMPRTGRLVKLPDNSFLVFQWKDDNPFMMEPEPTAFATVDDVLAEGWITD